MSNYEAFYYDDKSTNLTLLNRIEFKDQLVYRTVAKLREHLSTQADRILAEVNIQFRVDFDPLLFEKSEYSVNLSPTNLIGQKLARIKLKNRLKSLIQNNKHDNVTYRLGYYQNSGASGGGGGQEAPFEIGLFDGWLRARRELVVTSTTRKESSSSVYEIEIIAVNLDLQKSASVKCKVHVTCLTSGKYRYKSVWSLFELVYSNIFGSQ